MSEELLEKVQNVLEGTGAVATELGPDSVGVQGDARFYGPSVFVKFPLDMEQAQIALLSTKITNEVPGISRVLMEIPTMPTA